MGDQGFQPAASPLDLVKERLVAVALPTERLLRKLLADIAAMLVNLTPLYVVVLGAHLSIHYFGQQHRPFFWLTTALCAVVLNGLTFNAYKIDPKEQLKWDRRSYGNAVKAGLGWGAALIVVGVAVGTYFAQNETIAAARRLVADLNAMIVAAFVIAGCVYYRMLKIAQDRRQFLLWIGIHRLAMGFLEGMTAAFLAEAIWYGIHDLPISTHKPGSAAEWADYNALFRGFILPGIIGAAVSWWWYFRAARGSVGVTAQIGLLMRSLDRIIDALRITANSGRELILGLITAGMCGTILLFLAPFTWIMAKKMGDGWLAYIVDGILILFSLTFLYQTIHGLSRAWSGIRPRAHTLGPADNVEGRAHLADKSETLSAMGQSAGGKSNIHTKTADV